MPRVSARLLPLGLLCVGAVSPSAAQTAFDSPPNLGSAWTAPPGVLQFNLLHRFWLDPAPTRKLNNAPTLSFTYAVLAPLTVGVSYASNSDLNSLRPNEFELFGRAALMRQHGGMPVDLLVQGGYNTAVQSTDGQVLVARQVGALRAVGAVTVLGDAFGSDSTRVAVGAGVTVRLIGPLGIAGDVATLTGRSDLEDVAWSAGLLLGVGRSPHTLSLQATNVSSHTLQGMSRGSGRVRYGFEYTIPIPLSRYHAGTTGTGTVPETGAIAGRDTVHVVIQGMRFTTDRLEIAPGTTVVWENRDPLLHTVSADAGGVDSGEIAPGKSWSTTFLSAGTFGYHCTPHPVMKATIIVR